MWVMYGDLGRYAEMWGDVWGYGELWGNAE